MFTHALCRRPGPDLGDGLTTADLGDPDAGLALVQHAAYVSALRGLGLAVAVLDAAPGLPDAHFVEDAAVLTPEVAVLTRPGHPARRGEVAGVERALAGLLAESRPLARIEPPGTLDGGDVLQVDGHVLIGLSERTNRAGAEQLGALLARHGRSWSLVPVAAGLHLKSSVNELGERLLVTGAFAAREELARWERLVVPAGEEYAACALRINDTVVVPAGHPRTRALVEDAGFRTVAVDLSEMRKMDGGLSCLSLRW